MCTCGNKIPPGEHTHTRPNIPTATPTHQRNNTTHASAHPPVGRGAPVASSYSVAPSANMSTLSRPASRPPSRNISGARYLHKEKVGGMRHKQRLDACGSAALPACPTGCTRAVGRPLASAIANRLDRAHVASHNQQPGAANEPDVISATPGLKEAHACMHTHLASPSCGGPLPFLEQASPKSPSLNTGGG